VLVSAKIPFDNAVTEALINGSPVVKYPQSKAAAAINTLWKRIATT
jgi:MinD superfamily P-loop ATPase